MQLSRQVLALLTAGALGSTSAGCDGAVDETDAPSEEQAPAAQHGELARDEPRQTESTAVEDAAAQTVVADAGSNAPPPMQEPPESDGFDCPACGMG